MAAEVVPIVNCYCYGDDISSCEEKEKTTAFYSRLADVSLHYTGPIGYGIAVP